MKLTSRITSAVILAALMALFLGQGCSGDSALSPTAGDVSQAIVTSAAGEPTFVETFDKGSNVGGWSFFGNPHNRIEMIEPKDGNPGAYLHATCGQFGCLDTYAPQLRTEAGVPSIFTGDYRANKVSRIGVDIAIFGAANTGWRPLSVILRNDNGTPEQWADDVTVFWTGTKMIPMPNGVFKEFEFSIPSQETTLPKNWKVMYGQSSGDVDADWNKVITDVSQITFFYGDPEMFFMFQLWDLGVDNPRIWLDN